MRIPLAFGWLLLTGFVAIGPARAQRPEQPPLEINELRKAPGATVLTDRANAEAEARRQDAEGKELYEQGNLAAAIEKMAQALAVRRKLFPPKDYPHGHPDLATSLNNLGFLLGAQQEYGKALPYVEQALAMCQQLYPKERYPQGHADLAKSLNNLGFLLKEQGEHGKALPYVEQALAMYQQLYPKESYPQGHPHLANILGNLGNLLEAQGDNAKALPYYEQALAMYQQLYPKETYPQGHPDLGKSLNNLGHLLQAQGEYGKALSCHEQALTMRQQLFPKARYPEGHADLASSLNNLGAVLQAQGEYGKALTYRKQALAMCRQLYPQARYPQGHLHLAHSLNNLGTLLEARGEYRKALPYFEEALAMRQRLYLRARYPLGHADLAGSLNNLGTFLQAQGEYRKALPYLEQALAMRQRLYPKERYPLGHPDVANGLSNLGMWLQNQGQYGKALSYVEQALAMRQRLYPKERYPQGHPDLARSLNNLGLSLHVQGEYGKALPYYEQALAMYQQLYPKERYPQGHPDLAVCLGNLGGLLEVQGEYGKALPYDERALAMWQRLYPKERYPQGHPDLARSLYRLGITLQAQGEYGKALFYFKQALAMHRGHVNRFLTAAPEGQALAFLRSQPLTRDAYLSVTTQTQNPAPLGYAEVWQSRAQLSRLLQRRHQSTRIALAASEETRHKWQDLLDARRHLARLLLEPGKDLAARDQELARLTDRKESLERALVGLLPELEQATDLYRLGPKDLAGFLPQGTAFVDVLRYTHTGKGRTWTARYVAFVVRPDRTIRRVELLDAQPIEAALQKWRQGIASLEDTPAQAAAVARLVWDPLARELPAGTTTVYLAPDGELARLPWAALPGRKPGTVLLDDLTIAVVPHGPFLLEQLKYPSGPVTAKETVLALGAVSYGPTGNYTALPGTAAEIQQVTGLAGARARVVLAKDEATWSKLREALPQARYAHLATHGFFNAKALLEEGLRVERQLKAWEFQADRMSERPGLGLRSPLSYTGLVLAGANRPSGAEDGGIVTGEALVELPLEGLRLCVLSACETGLGDLGAVGGEGVQGLQRAFHLAGCPNVIASLWSVNDQATAALMAKFYHELWSKGKTPLAALREAQLTILRHPERIAALADRAAPNADTVIRLPPGIETERRAPTKLWAAFVLSGVGQ